MLHINNYRDSENLCVLKGIKGGNDVIIGNEDLEKNFLKSKKVKNFENHHYGKLTFYVKNNECQIKIKKQYREALEAFDLKFYLKHPDIPGDEDGWNFIQNLNIDDTCTSLMGNIELLETGEIKNPEDFRICTVSNVDEDIFSCMIVKNNSPEGDQVEDNTLVQGIFNSSRKTRKRVPGNLYMNQSTDRLCFLGDFYSRPLEINDGKSDPFPVNLVYINQKHLTDETKISDVILKCGESLHRNYRDKNLEIFDKNSSWINLGEKLKYDPDFDIRDHWEELVEKYIKKYKVPVREHATKYRLKHARKLFSIFQVVQSPTGDLKKDSSKITPRCRELIKESFSLLIEDILTEYYWKPGDVWVSEGGYYSLKEFRDLSEEDRKTRILFFIYRDYCQDNYLYLRDELDCCEKLDKLVKEFFGLDIKEIYDETLNKFKKEISDPIKEVQDLVNWKQRILRWKQPCSTIIQTTKFRVSCYSRIEDHHDDLDKWPTEDSTELRKALLSIYSKCFKDSGNNVSRFEIVPQSYRNKKTCLMTCIISIEDIISHFGGIDKIPQKVQEDLVNHAFTEFKIQTNNDKLKLT